MDIPESVVSASGADALCSQLLSYRRGDLSRERVYPVEKDVSEEEIRIGVVTCLCGANIGRVVDTPSVADVRRHPAQRRVLRGEPFRLFH